jgi:exonuclease SbcC
MKLRSLAMRYFRQHADTSVRFPDGLVGIIGSNGAGKTTILEAIAFALFGSKALRGKVEDVRTRTAPFKSGRGKRDQEMRVELAIELEGIVFKIERSLTDASLFVGGDAGAIASGNREVSNKVSALIGMSHEEFVATYCTEQKGLEFLSGKKGTTEREKFIIRMMGYNRLEELQESLRGDRRDKRSVLVGYEASLGSREEIELRLGDEQEKLAAVKTRHAEAVQSLIKLEQDFSVIHDRMRKWEDSRAQFLKERDLVQALEVRLEERMKRRRGTDDALVVSRDDLARSLKPLIGARDLDDALAEVKREIATRRDAVDEATRRLQEEEIAWKTAISGIAAERSALERQVDQLSKKAKKMGELDASSECPTCSQPLGESFESVNQHVRDEIAKLRQRCAELREAERLKSTTPEAVERAKLRCREEAEVVQKSQARLQELQNCHQLREKVQQLEVARQSVEGEIASATENLERARIRLKDIKFSEDDYNKDKGAHDASQRLLEVARLQRVRLEGELNTHEAMVTRSKEELSKFDERRAEIEKLRRDVRVFDECDRIVTDFRKFVNSSIRPRLAELASEYLADLTDGRYSAVELDEDFTPTVLEDGEPKRVISGGEEDILNLCMRISLSHMLAERAGQSFSLLMLDEVFGSLDEGRRGNVLALLEKLRRRFEQIVIITHLDDIKDGVQHLIQVGYDESTGNAYVADVGDLEVDFDLALNL